MHWEKLGNVYTPSAIHPKLISHASNPLPIHVEDDVYRIFFSGRDDKNRSSVGFVDIDLMKQKIVYTHDKPAFEHGPNHSYYSDGVSIGSYYVVNEARYILFMGWKCFPNGLWQGELGRLLLNSDYSLSLQDEKPFIPLNSVDPINVSYPWIDYRDGFYRMWYGSTITRDPGNGEMVHVINQATSTDGSNWERKGLAVPFILGVAQAFSRPTVVGNASEGFHMWFSYRGNADKYRIGYASSSDGEAWSLRLQDSGIDVSPSGWDSEMICYPFIFDHKGQRYMLYNGNGYGKTGFGLAIMA